MSQPNDWSKATRDYKRMKNQKGVWRPVNTQPHSLAGKEKEKMDFRIGIGEREYSSVMNTKSGTMENDSRKDSDDTVVEIQTSNQDVESKSLEYGKDAEESLETSRHSANVEVDDSLLRFVKGKGGNVQKKIQEKTGVKLCFVSTPKKTTTVVVDGPSVKSVTTATETIQHILDEAVKSPSLQYSHFISLPLAVHTELVEKLTDFQNSVLALSGSAGKDESDSDSNSNAESSDDDFEGTKIAVDLSVEDNTEHVKVEMLEIPVNNESSKIPGSISGIKSTHAHPADDNSNEKEAVAVNLNVDGDNVRVKLDVKSITQDVNAKSQTLYSRARWGIDKSIFIKPATFHLTVLMLKLWNSERVAAAAEILRNVSPKVKEALEGHPIAVTLKGLALMRGSPQKAHVLYARVEEVGSGERLRRACQVIIDAFVEAGLVLEKDSRSSLKLHATVMNTSHRKMKKFQRNKRNVPFDARPILERYGHKDWGEYVISEAHLSQRFSYDENGYYQCCASIPFPEIGRESAVETTVQETTEATIIAEVTSEETAAEE